jgi:hypothetical protein
MPPSFPLKAGGQKCRLSNNCYGDMQLAEAIM